MMKKTLCALALAVASVVIVAPPAQADTPRCVTRAEYRHVHQGMTKRRVHRIVDTRGRRVAYASVGRFTSEVRSYRACRRFSAVSFAYRNGRLSAKSAIWSRRR